MSGRHVQRGFTLMEVLVAMTILSLSLLAAFKVASEVSTSAVQLQDKTFAQWVALNKLTEARVQTGFPTPGKSDGEAELAGRTWHWVMEIKATPNKDILQLEASVWPESEKDSPVPTALVTAFKGRL